MGTRHHKQRVHQGSATDTRTLAEERALEAATPRRLGARRSERKGAVSQCRRPGHRSPCRQSFGEKGSEKRARERAGVPSRAGQAPLS